MIVDRARRPASPDCRMRAHAQGSKRNLDELVANSRSGTKEEKQARVTKVKRHLNDKNWILKTSNNAATNLFKANRALADMAPDVHRLALGAQHDADKDIEVISNNRARMEELLVSEETETTLHVQVETLTNSISTSEQTAATLREQLAALEAQQAEDEAERTRLQEALVAAQSKNTTTRQALASIANGL